MNMNLNELFQQAKSNLESARQSLVQLTDGLKNTDNTDFAAVMEVATSVATAESKLADLARSWVEAAQAANESKEFNDASFLKEQKLYFSKALSPKEQGTSVTFNFDKFFPGETE